MPASYPTGGETRSCSGWMTSTCASGDDGPRRGKPWGKGWRNSGHHRPNGAGKTCTLNCINGFYRPQREIFSRDRG
jgi:hypothetical protein